MEKLQFKRYCDAISCMAAEVSDWRDRTGSIVADYLRDDSSRGYGMVLTKLIGDAYASVTESYAQSKINGVSVDLCEIASAIMAKKRIDNFRFSAYLFAVGVAAVSSGNACVDDIDYDLFDYNEFIAFDSAASVSEETDPVKRELAKFRVRLLDFSRTNQLVHFRYAKKSTLQLYSPNLHATLKAVTRGQRIHIAGWQKLTPSVLYKCRICGSTAFGKYDFNNKKTQNAAECPVCDAGNAHNRKSMAPVKEQLKVLTDEGYVCKCGARTPLAEIRAQGKCHVCGASVSFDSYPVITRSELGVYLPDEMICSVGDASAKEALKSIMNKAKYMERNFGLHVMYLACGFLEWKDVNGTEYRSPILLCPISLGVDKSKGTYYFEADPTGSGMFEVNKTLLRMLSSYSRTLSIELPELDESNVGAYLAVLKQYLADGGNGSNPVTSAWRVDQSFGIGLFHYQKLQLQHDIECNADKYLENPLIRRLCKDDKAKIETTVSKKRHSMEYVLLDADSSQEEVIKAAQEGRSFILQGPPGSGKSQTITNIIASVLGEGKTVLFVTEKASARAVILENFNKCRVGSDNKLTEFVLDFEGVKKRGKAVVRSAIVDELNKCLTTLSYSGGYDDELLAKEARQYAKVREFMRESCGEYSGRNYMRLIRDAVNYAEYPELRTGFTLPSDWDGILRLCDAIGKYYAGIVTLRSDADYRNDPLCGCKGDADGELCEYAERYIATVRGITETVNTLTGYGWVTGTESDRLSKSLSLMRLWSEMPRVTETVLSDLSLNRISDLLNRVRERRDLLQRIAAHAGGAVESEIDRAVFDSTDLGNIESGLEYNRFPLRRLSGEYKALVKKVYSCFRSRVRDKKYAAVSEAFSELMRYKSYLDLKKIDEIRSREDADKFGYAPSTDREWEELEVRLQTLRDIISANDSAILDLRSVSDWSGRFASSGYSGFIGSLRRAGDELEKAVAAEEDLRNKLSGYFDDLPECNDGNYCREYVKVAETVVNNASRLKNWRSLYETLKEIKVNGWRALLGELMKNGVTTYEEAKGRIYKTYYRDRVKKFVEDNRLVSIGEFSRVTQEQLIRDYSDVDLKVLDSAARRLYEKLRSSLKAYVRSDPAHTGDPGKIQSVANYSIKRTISENIEYIRKIKPCFMMSPLNVSQYIDADVRFDLVIFDEASQIFTEDALAAIMRGRQVIIAGDSKQLPPCDFFKAGDSVRDDEESYFDEEAEHSYSLLDTAAEALNDASISLTWHYRSADESLIAFANEHMDYNLITFPSAVKDPNDGIRFHSVAYDPAACYVAGKRGAHVNPGEADRVLELIYSEMTNPERCKFSIGVVAFSNAQATEIEARWEAFRADPVRKPVIERWEKEHEDEPLIFCNLDTVQGDERDTVIISVCYGKDASGKFILPYLGRIRLPSGKKRLNVAVTRSRHQMIVVSMLDGATLKNAILNSSAPEENKAGAQMLYDFLEYARSFTASREVACSETCDPLVKSVCRVLDKAGVAYDTEIGRSECKINVGIRDPENKGSFVLGIVIDDPNRADFDSVREYTRLTEQILSEKYGWRLYRIFPASWFNDFENEKVLLLNKVNEALRGKKTA